MKTLIALPVIVALVALEMAGEYASDAAARIAEWAQRR